MNKKYLLLLFVLSGFVLIKCTKEEKGKAPISVFRITNSEVLVYSEVKFKDASVNEPTEWMWDFGDGITSIEQNPSHRYMETGTYTASLTVKNSFGQDSYSKPNYINVVKIPPPGFSVSDKIAMVGEPVIFSDTSNFDGLEWLWDFGDGIESNDKNPEHSYASAGEYNVKLTIKHTYDKIINQKDNYIKVYNEVVTDIDNNKYGIVEIGTQKWFANNLKTTKFNTGVEIPLVNIISDYSHSWGEGTTPRYCWYSDDKQFSDSAEYGALYNYYTVETEKICPVDWHVPSALDWRILEQFLSDNGYSEIEGVALKSKSGWKNNANGQDIYGFSALPAGGLTSDNNWSWLYDLAESTTWWSSSAFSDKSMTVYYMQYSSHRLKTGGNYKNNGQSIRCIKD